MKSEKGRGKMKNLETFYNIKYVNDLCTLLQFRDYIINKVVGKHSAGSVCQTLEFTAENLAPRPTQSLLLYHEYIRIV